MNWLRLSLFVATLSLCKCHQVPHNILRREFKDRSYYFFKTPEKTWHEAQSECKKYGGNLASASTLQIYNFIVKIGSQEETPFWIGGNRVSRKDMKFEWIENGQLVSSFAWLPNQPDNHLNTNEACMNIWKPNAAYGGNDVTCDLPFSYLCSIKDVTSASDHPVAVALIISLCSALILII